MIKKILLLISLRVVVVCEYCKCINKKAPSPKGFLDEVIRKIKKVFTKKISSIKY